MNKKCYGQFFTTNYKYIMDGMLQPDNMTHIIEPFAGNKDMINFINLNNYQLECYDIEPQSDDVIQRDTIDDPPSYNSKYIITNPPFLARNKSSNKYLFDKYGFNDLYKCFIYTLIQDYPKGGIIILPLNFWCSIRYNDIELRKLFISKFEVQRVNVFEEKVFEDTSYTICCIQFKRIHNQPPNMFPFYIYPTKQLYTFEMTEHNNYTIGGEIYDLFVSPHISITRLTRDTNLDNMYITNINVYAIDNNKNKRIRLELVSDEDRYIDITANLSARTFATLVISPIISLELQKKIVDNFNTYMTRWRTKYNSLFLTNYRESKDISRKRISFSLVYRIVNYLLTLEE